jgi:hypothetical protein
VWLGERVGDAPPGVDDERAVHGGAEPGAVRVPPQRALLPLDGEAVRVAAAGADGALRHELRPVRPPVPQLPEAVPVEGHVVPGQVHGPDRQRVAAVHLDRRPRELPVHRDDLLGLAQPLHWRPLDLQQASKATAPNHSASPSWSTEPRMSSNTYDELVEALLGEGAWEEEAAEHKKSGGAAAEPHGT